MLSLQDLQEADRIVAILTAEHGKVRGVARGSKRKFSRLAAGLHPLARVEVTWTEKATSDLVRFSTFDLLRAADELQGNLEDILYAAYLADHAETFAQENDASPEMYRLLNRVVEALLGGADREAVVRYFEVWTLRLMGVLGEPAACLSCGGQLHNGASLAEGGFFCQECAGRDGTISRQALGFVAVSRQRSPEEVAQLNWPVDVLAEVDDICATIRRRFMGTELRSYAVLKDMLREST